MVVVNLWFACLYFALSLARVVVRQSRFASWPLPFLHGFTTGTAHIGRLHIATL